MKKLSILALFLVCCLFLNGFICVAPENAVATETKDSSSEVLKARMENILNLNTVYDNDFYDNQKLVNAALLRLQPYADDDGFVKNEIVSAYIKDMYDIDLLINEKINEGYPQKSGYVLIIPRGYSEYSHTVENIEVFEDYILVTSKVTVATHDNGSYEAECKTAVIENENSVFGYSIINSEISDNNDYLKI